MRNEWWGELQVTQKTLNIQKKLQKAGLAFNRFWFTDLDSVSANEPRGILERIFFTPKDFEEGVLYSFLD